MGGEGCEESLGRCRMCSELHWSEEATLLNVVYGTLYALLLYFTALGTHCPNCLIAHHQLINNGGLPVHSMHYAPCWLSPCFVQAVPQQAIPHVSLLLDKCQDTTLLCTVGYHLNSV